MSERTVVLAFCAGLVPTAVLSVAVLSLFRRRCVTLRNERDALRRVCDEVERRYGDATTVEQSNTLLDEPPPALLKRIGLPQPSIERVEIEEALVSQMAHTARMAEELAQLRQEHRKLQAVVAREKERIGRVVRDLKISVKHG
jgi:hypothetical protein